MQPERPIEKLLKAFARKRRHQAGTGFELHPATRRLLQGEVARQFRQTDGRRVPWWQSWAGVGPRVAFATGTLAAVVIIGVLLYPPATEKQETPLSLVREVSPESADDIGAMPTMASAPAASLAAPTALLDSSADADSANQARRTYAPVTESVAAYRIAPGETLKDKAAVALDSSRAEVTDSTKQTKSSLARPAMPIDGQPSAKLPLPLDDSAPARAARGIGPTKGDLRMTAEAERKRGLAEPPAQFLRAGEGRTEGTAATAAAIAQMPLLTMFQLEQHGTEIRITDADGSVYSGSVVGMHDTTTAAESETRRVQPAQGPQRTTGNLFGMAQSKVSTPMAIPQPTLNFVVRGTNATLRQVVVFTGSLQQAALVQQWPASNQTPNVVLRFQNQSPLLKQAQKSQLNGRARLANGAELEINAIALPPEGDRTP